jgi:CubicO group peptidase (beta-lactamase class C family)
MYLSRVSSILLSLFLSSVKLVHCSCNDPSPAFPPPKLHPPSNVLKQAFKYIEASIEAKASPLQYDTTAFSLEITSSQSALWEYHHTARKLSTTNPGANPVNGSSSYRIASITKVFTVLSILQQHAKGTLQLDDSVSQYLPELSGKLPWRDITLRALGSQLSGIPGDLFQSDIINDFADPTMLGLPPKSRDGLPTCDEYSSFARACNEGDLMEQLRKQRPIFAPAQQPSYCNIGFEILGLVLEKVTGMGFSEYVHAMLKEIDIEGITFDKPDDEAGVLPAGGTTYWDVEMGVQRP